jgi:hypothetical protein
MGAIPSFLVCRLPRAQGLIRLIHPILVCAFGEQSNVPSKLARFRLSIEVDSALPATCEGCSTLSLRSLRRWRDAVLEDPVGRKPGMDQVCGAKQLQRAAVLPLA